MCSRKGMLLTALYTVCKSRSAADLIRPPSQPTDSICPSRELLWPGRFSSFHHVVIVSTCNHSTLLERIQVNIASGIWTSRSHLPFIAHRSKGIACAPSCKSVDVWHPTTLQEGGFWPQLGHGPAAPSKALTCRKKGRKDERKEDIFLAWIKAQQVSTGFRANKDLFE